MDSKACKVRRDACNICLAAFIRTHLCPDLDFTILPPGLQGNIFLEFFLMPPNSWSFVKATKDKKNTNRGDDMVLKPWLPQQEQAGFS